jgi:hypothetical protein
MFFKHFWSGLQGNGSTAPLLAFVIDYLARRWVGLAGLSRVARWVIRRYEAYMHWHDPPRDMDMNMNSVNDMNRPYPELDC